MRRNGNAKMLREYESTAQKYHQCHHCMTDICPGEIYKGEVWVQGELLWVRKIHIYCPIDPDKEYFRDLSDEKDDDSVKEVDFENIPAAA